MPNPILKNMLSRYKICTKDDYINALHEVMQQTALAGLCRNSFFNRAAFYGDACLRIFNTSYR
jgi:hypothetical protein